jgi:hypothetical protein
VISSNMPPMTNGPIPIESGFITQPNLNILYPCVCLPTPAGVHIDNRIRQVLHETLKELGYYENPRTEVQGFFEVKTNQRMILSLCLIVYAFAGGAHGTTAIPSMTFNAQTGREYSLAEEFQSGVDYVTPLSEMVKQQIQERGIETFEPFTSIQPDQPYYLADKCIVLYFPPYEITPYYMGFQYFPINLYLIEELLDENAPAYRQLPSF